MSAVKLAMPHYPLDAEFERAIPPELDQAWADWEVVG
jgi:hypothetical protein